MSILNVHAYLSSVASVSCPKGYSQFFIIRRLGPSIYSFPLPPPPPKKNRNIKNTIRIFKILLPKNVPILSTLTSRKSIKMYRNDPTALSEVARLYNDPKNINNFFLPPKIFIFLKKTKILIFKHLTLINGPSLYLNCARREDSGEIARERSLA